MYVCIYIYIEMSLSIYLSIHPSNHPSIHLSTYLCTYNNCIYFTIISAWCVCVNSRLENNTIKFNHISRSYPQVYPLNKPPYGCCPPLPGNRL